MSKNESIKRQLKNKVSRIKHQTSYTYRDKGHLSKDCLKTRTSIHKIINDNITHLGPKIDTSTIKVVSSPCDSHHGIWVPKHLLTNHE
jgi:CII-binding regulator of phage lambda lysogenization HflD